MLHERPHYVKKIQTVQIAGFRDYAVLNGVFSLFCTKKTENTPHLHISTIGVPYSNSPYLFTKILLKSVASSMYRKTVSASQPKK